MSSYGRTMPRPAPRGRNSGARSTLASVGALNPEWRAWIALVEATNEERKSPVWTAAAPDIPAPARPPDAPLLHGITFELEPRPARRWLRRLTKVAAKFDDPGARSIARLRFRRLDALSFMEAAVAQDMASIEGHAVEAGVDATALAALADLAVRPLLHAAAHALARHAPHRWLNGYCPMCGAWPALAEIRGIDRARRLRCTRCGGDWSFDVLHCPFCGERDHRNQGSLVPDGEEDIRKVDTCRSCQGYLKSLRTLSAIALGDLVLEDLATVELDIAALERGFARPERPGYAIDVRIGHAERPPLVRTGGDA